MDNQERKSTILTVTARPLLFSRKVENFCDLLDKMALTAGAPRLRITLSSRSIPLTGSDMARGFLALAPDLKTVTKTEKTRFQ